jgi:cell division transport system permease protein
MSQRFVPPIGEEQPVVIGLTTIWSENIETVRPSKLALCKHVVRQALENLRRSPITAILTLLTITTALFLLGIFGLFSQNLSRAKGLSANDVKVHVFLREGLSDSSREELVRDLEKVTRGAQISYVSKDTALHDFREMLGDDSVILEGIDTENPLPSSLSISFENWRIAEPAFAEIENLFGSDPRVETIRFTRQIAAQLGKVAHVLRIIGYAGIVFLVLVAGFITSNTINLALFGHRMEIEIMRLVGAQRASIYAPYVLEGLLQGGVAASLAISTLWVIFVSLKDQVVTAEPLQMIVPSLSFLSFGFLLLILLVGVLIGTVSSFFAVRRFLRAE